MMNSVPEHDALVKSLSLGLITRITRDTHAY